MSSETTSLLPDHEKLPTHHAPPTRHNLKFPLNIAPEKYHPYMELIRLDKPTGTILMFWPLAWGLTMASYSMAPAIALHSYAYKLIECFVGAFIIRSSACTVNDIFDMNVDAGVERTKNRPLPSGRITVLAATVFLLVQYALGILFFYLTIDGLAFYAALFQLLPLFAIYPLLKRVTYWPQAWLGFAMNFGFVTAYVSTANTFNYDILCCALAGCWCWTMLYDTIYACQDIIDDVKTGVLSTAILFGTWIRPMLVGCAMIFIAMLFVAGYLNRQDWGYFVFSVCGTATHLVWQLSTVELDKPESCWKNFKRNGQLGWIVWGGLLIDYTSKSATFIFS
ncbi:uncharacterized protein ARMOST_16620 [Armillaria ostoyae]|uniref:4-hydroxybenzoate polyprenyltransferase, mitochondrial n=1 Tax=Armillaria ostoyae TaxID=47428 RepID=A0A284RWR2_ARMOS|nr:uncharacterized protein ARMOST_16620 [Armillaria ostoyae]